MITKKIINSFLISVIIFFINENIIAKDWKMIEDLSGRWKFKIGDDLKWAEKDYNDSGWDKIDVPSAWEDQGYNGYDGYAWYRKRFNYTNRYSKEDIYLSLGFIDDVAEIYVNGKMIARHGSFPPNLITAYNNKVKYMIPKEYLKVGSKSNIIAVRVYDRGGVGGIYTGNVGLYVSDSSIPVEISLEGTWKYKTGDNRDWKENNFDDSNWGELVVPWAWDMQGLEDYDGFVWYRKSFKIIKDFDSDDLVLLVGKIDDMDETYLNGKLIGSTGDLIARPITKNMGNDYSYFRGYYFNKKDLDLSGENLIAVRVYDGHLYGGIFEGPVGITTLKKYTDYIKDKMDTKKNFIEKLFGKD